jgi:hypothetical protein
MKNLRLSQAEMKIITDLLYTKIVSISENYALAAGDRQERKRLRSQRKFIAALLAKFEGYPAKLAELEEP